MEPRSRTSEHAKRRNQSLLAGPERRFLYWMAPRIPPSLGPDHFTILALVGAAITAAGYTYSNQDSSGLWWASAGLFLHWFGDSLDGTLARVRKAERPKYGFYVDHLADAAATAMIGLGLGFSPYMLLGVGLAIVVAYLVLSINVYLETITVGEFRLDYGIVGPTEGRILLMVLNTAALLLGPNEFSVPSLTDRALLLTPFDVVGLAGVLAMTLMLMRRTSKNLRALLALDEAARRKKESGEDLGT